MFAVQNTNFYVIVYPDVLTKIYWTGLTKSGCVGQYTNCFKEDSDGWSTFTVITNKGGGACVGVTTDKSNFIAKALPCDSKLYLACQATNSTVPGEKNTVGIFL